MLYARIRAANACAATTMQTFSRLCAPTCPHSHLRSAALRPGQNGAARGAWTPRSAWTYWAYRAGCASSCCVGSQLLPSAFLMRTWMRGAAHGRPAGTRRYYSMRAACAPVHCTTCSPCSCYAMRPNATCAGSLTQCAPLMSAHIPSCTLTIPSVRGSTARFGGRRAPGTPTTLCHARSPMCRTPSSRAASWTAVVDRQVRIVLHACLAASLRGAIAPGRGA